MSSAKKNQTDYDALLKVYEQAQAHLERARMREKTAKSNLKTAEKREDSKSEIEILRLELVIAKAKRKARKAGANITKIQIKQWVKANAKSEKSYQLTIIEEPKETPEAPQKLSIIQDAAPEIAEGKAGSYVSKENDVEAVQTLIAEEPKKARRPRRSSAEAAAEREAKQAELRANGEDFTIVEGIGPAVTKQLHEMGIKSFQDLAQSDVVAIQEMLKSRRNNIADPTTWAQQAQLILNNDHEALKILQESLRKKRTPSNKE